MASAGQKTRDIQVSGDSCGDLDLIGVFRFLCTPTCMTFSSDDFYTVCFSGHPAASFEPFLGIKTDCCKYQWAQNSSYRWSMVFHTPLWQVEQEPALVAPSDQDLMNWPEGSIEFEEVARRRKRRIPETAWEQEEASLKRPSLHSTCLSFFSHSLIQLKPRAPHLVEGLLRGGGFRQSSRQHHGTRLPEGLFRSTPSHWGLDP